MQTRFIVGYARTREEQRERLRVSLMLREVEWSATIISFLIPHSATKVLLCQRLCKPLFLPR